MKRTIAIFAACLPALLLNTKADAGSPHPQVAAHGPESPAGASGGTRPPIYRCSKCNAPTGGVYYPLCPDCHYKEQNQPVKPGGSK